MRRRKKGEITKLKEKLWKLVRAEVIERDNSTCQRTGQHVEGSNCHVSHIIPRSAGNALRFDPMNLKVLSYQRTSLEIEDLVGKMFFLVFSHLLVLTIRSLYSEVVSHSSSVRNRPSFFTKSSNFIILQR